MARKKQADVNGSGSNGEDAELARFVERVERLEEERRSLAHDIIDVLTEAADAGFPKKAIRIAAKRKLETPEAKARRVSDEDALNDVLFRLGMLADTPLGNAAVVQLHPTQQ